MVKRIHYIFQIFMVYVNIYQYEILEPAHLNQYHRDEIKDRFHEESHPCSQTCKTPVSIFVTENDFKLCTLGGGSKL